jgi:hypothetical protein
VTVEMRATKDALMSLRGRAGSNHTLAALREVELAEKVIEAGRLETLRQIMGHSSVRTTVDLYAHLDLSDARIDVLLLDLATNAT